MKTAYKIVLFALLAYFPNSTFSQFSTTVQGNKSRLTDTYLTGNAYSTSLSNLIFENFLNQREKLNPIELSDIKGSAYLSETFEPGVFFFKDEQPTNLMLRYNMYDDEIEAQESNGKISGFLKVNGSKFKVGYQIILPYRIVEDGDEKMANLILLSDGQIKLLQRKKVILVNPEKATNPNQMDRAAKFVPKDTYYFQILEGKLMKFNGKKKELFALFSNKEDELKSFLKMEKINLKKEKDMIKLATFLNDISS